MILARSASLTPTRKSSGAMNAGVPPAASTFAPPPVNTAAPKSAILTCVFCIDDDEVSCYNANISCMLLPQQE